MENPVLAKWWEPTENGKLLCTLCPRYCIIDEGQNGFCYIRQNIKGNLYSICYGKPSGFSIDPMEKKPLYHFLPGTGILSFGTAGCNLGCKFCQNWAMSKAKSTDIHSLHATPDEVVNFAKNNNVLSIAYTYNEPTVFGEYVIDTSRLASEEEIKSVMVTNGYIDKEARKDVYKYIDAANVDLKAFTEEFYNKLTSSHLNDVLDTLIWLKNETDVWIEITNLVIPGENDSEDEIKQMSNWILKNLGDSVPLHFSAFHPDFKLIDIPHTPASLVKSARQIAINEGIKYCYVGNIIDSEGSTTYCPKCNTPLINRDRQTMVDNKIKNSHCHNCRTKIEGVFN